MSSHVMHGGRRMDSYARELAEKATRERWRLEAELEQLFVDREMIIQQMEDLELRLRHEIRELSPRAIGAKLGIGKPAALAIERDLELSNLPEYRHVIPTREGAA